MRRAVAARFLTLCVLTESTFPPFTRLSGQRPSRPSSAASAGVALCVFSCLLRRFPKSSLTLFGMNARERRDRTMVDFRSEAVVLTRKAPESLKDHGLYFHTCRLITAFRLRHRVADSEPEAFPWLQKIPQESAWAMFRC